MATNPPIFFGVALIAHSLCMEPGLGMGMGTVGFYIY